MSDMKTFQFKEGVKIVAGLNVALDTIGSFYVYAWAVIVERFIIFEIIEYYWDKDWNYWILLR